MLGKPLVKLSFQRWLPLILSVGDVLSTTCLHHYSYITLQPLHTAVPSPIPGTQRGLH
jgi:hypothetical protein